MLTEHYLHTDPKGAFALEKQHTIHTLSHKHTRDEHYLIEWTHQTEYRRQLTSISVISRIGIVKPCVALRCMFSFSDFIINIRYDHVTCVCVHVHIHNSLRVFVLVAVLQHTVHRPTTKSNHFD